MKKLILTSILILGVMVYTQAQQGQRGKGNSDNAPKGKQDRIENRANKEGDNTRAHSRETHQRGKSVHHKKDSASRAAEANLTPEEREARRQEREKQIKERKEMALKKLEEQKSEGKITDEEYTQRKQAIEKGYRHKGKPHSRGQRGDLTPEQREQYRTERMEHAMTRVANAKSSLEAQKKKGEISDEEYQKRLENLNKREDYLKKTNVSAAERANWTKEEREAHIQMRKEYNKNRKAEARKMLEEKKAKGEISEDEYNEKMNRLNGAEKKSNNKHCKKGSRKK